jgi:hypothetical protein
MYLCICLLLLLVFKYKFTKKLTNNIKHACVEARCERCVCTMCLTTCLLVYLYKASCCVCVKIHEMTTV